MMQRSLFRILLGICLMGVAGISLTSGIFPVIATYLLDVNSYQIMFLVRSFVIPVAVFWAVCGGIVSWYGGPVTGTAVMGACGAVTGVILAAVAVGGGLLLVLAAMLAGLVYGGIGGFIIGKVFPRPTDQFQQGHGD